MSGPDVWGPHGWKFIHYVTLGYPDKPTKEDKNMGYRGKPQDSSFCIPAQHQELIVRMFTESSNLSQSKKEWKEIKRGWLVQK